VAFHMPFIGNSAGKIRGAMETIQLPAIRIHNASKVYPDGNQLASATAQKALKNVSLTIPRGGFVAITGPSGSGKSTLMNMMGCLDEPNEGEVSVLGTLVNSLKDEELTKLRAEKIGFVFQSFNLIPRLTVLQNVTMPMALLGKLGRAEREEKARKLLADVGLSSKEKKFPAELSGGEKQRVAIARALANDPTIILADEPTGNLDSRSGRQVLDILEELNAQKGVTVVIVTHDESIASEAKLRVLMRDGKVEEVVMKRELAPPAEAKGLEVLGSSLA